MKVFREEMERRAKEQRQHVRGNWSGLIFKIALLIAAVYLLTNSQSRSFLKLDSLFSSKTQTSVQGEHK